MDILPISIPLGRDAESVLHEPARLRIKRASTTNDVEITDAWHREVIYVRKQDRSVRQRHSFFSATTGAHMFDLRRSGSTSGKIIRLLVVGNIGGGHWILEDTQGQEIATIDYQTPGKSNDRTWNISFRNTANKGEAVVVRVRGRWSERLQTLMLMKEPVVVLDRSGTVSDATVAAGVDFIWAACMLAIFQVVDPRF